MRREQTCDAAKEIDRRFRSLYQGHVPCGHASRAYRSANDGIVHKTTPQCRSLTELIKPGSSGVVETTFRIMSDLKMQPSQCAGIT